MPGRCFGCGKEPGGPEQMTFVYGGQKFQVSRSGLFCRKCQKKEAVAVYDKWLFKFFRGVGCRLVVNWGLYSQQGNPDVRDEMLDILQFIGALSRFPKSGSWIIRSEAIFLNPTRNGAILYFSAYDHLAGYVREMLANTTYNWQALRIGEVLSKEECLGK